MLRDYIWVIRCVLRYVANFFKLFDLKRSSGGVFLFYGIRKTGTAPAREEPKYFISLFLFRWRSESSDLRKANPDQSFDTCQKLTVSS